MVEYAMRFQYKLGTRRPYDNGHVQLQKEFWLPIGSTSEWCYSISNFEPQRFICQVLAFVLTCKCTYHRRSEWRFSLSDQDWCLCLGMGDCYHMSNEQWVVSNECQLLSDEGCRITPTSILSPWYFFHK